MVFNYLCNKGGVATLLIFCIFVWVPDTHAKSQIISHDDLDIKIGQAIFEKIWVFAPSSTKSSDGLGPLYNARSCKQCHGLSIKNKSSLPSSLVIHLSIEPSLDMRYQDTEKNLKELGFIPEPSYGKQLQTFAYPGAKAEAEISVSYEKVLAIFADGDQVSLSKPNYTIDSYGYGDFHPDYRWSPRVAPRMMGLNWLEAIPVETLLLNSDTEDSNNDGISGKINWVWDSTSQSTQAGRFGWKAAKANLEQQNLAALSTDIGVSSWLFPKAEGDCTEAQAHCSQLAKATETYVASSAHGDSPNQLTVEASKEMTDLLLRFTASLSPDQRLSPNNKDRSKLEYGRQLFNKIGCHSCHISQYDNVINTYSNDRKSTTIYPYTDLLLHDMGTSLADNRKEFAASGNEWRTSPLWGISKYLQESPNPHFLHDGRAKSVMDAILWHGGEAESSKQAFMNLPKEQRTSLINFVESL